VRDSGRHALAAEPIERPHEQEVELAPRRVGKHRRELLSVLDAVPPFSCSTYSRTIE
jgi:hypothetical protein